MDEDFSGKTTPSGQILSGGAQPYNRMSGQMPGYQPGPEPMGMSTPQMDGSMPMNGMGPAPGTWGGPNNMNNGIFIIIIIVPIGIFNK